MKNKNKGFVFAATNSKAYYNAAINSAISILDYYPSANITLFTEERFVEKRNSKYFNNIFTNNITAYHREKLNILSQSPYGITAYLDCDTEIHSTEIVNLFDLLENNNIVNPTIIPEVSKIVDIDKNGNKLTSHCGIMVYSNDKNTQTFFKQWNINFQKQLNESWDNNVDIRMKPWDQYAFWNTKKQFKDILKFKELDIETSCKYNYIYLLDNFEKYKRDDYVIYHYTIPQEKINEGFNIK